MRSFESFLLGFREEIREFWLSMESFEEYGGKLLLPFEDRPEIVFIRKKGLLAGYTGLAKTIEEIIIQLCGGLRAGNLQIAISHSSFNNLKDSGQFPAS